MSKSLEDIKSILESCIISATAEGFCLQIKGEKKMMFLSYKEYGTTPEILIEVLKKKIYSRFYKNSKILLNSNGVNIKEKYAEIQQSIQQDVTNGASFFIVKGWKINSLESESTIVAELLGERIRVTGGNFIKSSETLNRTLFEGQEVTIHFPIGGVEQASEKDKVGDYYHFFSQDLIDILQLGGCRFYFNYGPYKEVENQLGNFIQQLFEGLSLRKIPFQLKSVNFESNFGNDTDAAVLYINRRFLPASVDFICSIHSQYSDKLFEENTPLFTLKLGKGLGFAESPSGQGNSFGQHRSRILAELLAEFYLQNPTSDFPVSERKLANLENFVLDRLDSLGYDPNKWYFNPGQFPFETLLEEKFSGRNNGIQDLENLDAYPELANARDLGYLLCREAIWDWKNDKEKRCTWVISSTENEQTITKTLPKTFENGTLGVGYFLFCLYRYYPDPVFQDSAQGALGDKFDSKDNPQTLLNKIYEVPVLKDTKAKSFFTKVEQNIDNIQRKNYAYFTDKNNLNSLGITNLITSAYPDSELDFSKKVNSFVKDQLRKYVIPYGGEGISNANLSPTLFSGLELGLAGLGYYSLQEYVKLNKDKATKLLPSFFEIPTGEESE